jgi:DNA gyrase subunit A
MSDEERKPLPIGRIVHIDLEDEMKRSYLDYSMSVIVSRALPDVRDGLKPVHRRILYSMYEQRLTHQRPYKKSAAVVGDVLGKYHPHGDSAVYDAMVRMAQGFSLRHPLIDGQGNFGSVDGDPAAAYRYTEARMARIGELMLADIDRETVDFAPNFDQRLTEPVVLPSGLPNLLVNGASGIAVGMATNIPPHNLLEIIEACAILIGNPEASVEDLMKVVKGPDFPTGGVIVGRSGTRAAYTTGQGPITVRGTAVIEKSEKGRDAIVITEIPYQVNKATMISSIAELVKDRKITEIADIREESDREGMRVVIELKRDAIADVVLNQLYRHTDLEVTFGANMLALVGNTPLKLDLRMMLIHYIEHRHDVVLRRTMFDLGKAEERAHILEGLLKALDIIDEIVAAIRASSDAETARRSLIEGFGFSERQAQAILDMRLHRLTALERDELAAEQAELMQLIERLRALAGSREARMAVVLEELRAVGEAFGQPRRTRIDEDASNDLEMEDLIPDDSVVIMVSSAGYIKRLPLDTWKSQRRGGKGITGATTREEDSLEQVYVATNHSNILFITNLGYCYWLKAYRVPEETRHSKGKAIVNLLDLAQGERPVASICLRDRGESGYLVMVTSNGIVKRTPLSEYRRPRSTGLRAVRLAEGVGLVTASVTTGESEILLMSRRGRVIRFYEGDVRATGRYTSGVRGMRLVKGDEVVGMVVLAGEGDILSMTSNGYGKRTPVQEHPVRRRGGMGVIGIRASERNGPVVAVMQVPPENELILVSARGMVIRLHVSDVRLCGRNTQGVRLMNLPEDDRLVDATAFEPEGGEDSQFDASGNGRVDESV